MGKGKFGFKTTDANNSENIVESVKKKGPEYAKAGKKYSVIAFVGPGFEEEVSGTVIPLNDIIIKDKPDFDLRDRWYRIQNGYISAYRVFGWIKDDRGMRYERENHLVPKSTVLRIDDKDYVFDRNGYLVTADRISTEGHIVY